MKILLKVLMLAAVVFPALKLTHVINWSWWLVLIPLGVLIVVIILLIYLFHRQSVIDDDF